MKIHHLNCGTFKSALPSQITGYTELVTHCLLIELKSELVLIDSGFGLKDIQSPFLRLGISSYLLNASLKKEETAYMQVKKMGLDPRDVRHIVVTHLDMDHVGGLSDFPWAKVHIYESEWRLTQKSKQPFGPKRFGLERARYRPQQWAHGPLWEVYPATGESWNGFSCVRQLKNLPPEILLIALPGHSVGHCGIAIESRQGSIVHAGDAYFSKAELEDSAYKSHGLDLFERALAADDHLRVQNLARLRELAATALNKNGDRIAVFCAHDLEEFKKSL